MTVSLLEISYKTKWTLSPYAYILYIYMRGLTDDNPSIWTKTKCTGLFTCVHCALINVYACMYMCVHDLYMYRYLCITYICVCVCIQTSVCICVSVLFIECNFNYSYNYLQVEHRNKAEVGHVKHIDMVLLVIRHEPLWNELAAKKQFPSLRILGLSLMLLLLIQ